MLNCEASKQALGPIICIIPLNFMGMIIGTGDR